MFRLVKGLKTDIKEVEGGWYFRGSEMDCCVSVIREEVKSGRITWNGS